MAGISTSHSTNTSIPPSWICRRRPPIRARIPSLRSCAPLSWPAWVSEKKKSHANQRANSVISSTTCTNFAANGATIVVGSPRSPCAFDTYLTTPSHTTRATGKDTVEASYPSTIAPVATSEPSPQRSNQRGTVALLQCNVAGCDYERPFARKYELKRHVNQRHGGVRTFTCGALGCFKRDNQRWTFARLDKLTDHIRTVHAYDTAFSGCPVRDCNRGPQPLDVLGAHIQRAHGECDNESRSIENATIAKRRRCPLPGCNNKLYPLDSFPAHVATHEVRDIHASKSSQCFESLDFDFISELTSAGTTIVGLNICVTCPVCLFLSTSIEDFRVHLQASHLFCDPLQGAEHFAAWRDALGYSGIKLHSMTVWDHKTGRIQSSRTVRCPVCTYSAFFKAYTYELMAAEHPGLLKPKEQVVSELMPFRMQILRLYPDFLTHPVFENLI